MKQRIGVFFCKAPGWVTRSGTASLMIALAGLSLAVHASTRLTPSSVTINVKVLSSGAVEGNDLQRISVSRSQKPSGALQSCDKVDLIELESETDIHRGNFWHISRKDLGSLWLKPHLCNFTKTVTFLPFTDDEVRAVCIGHRSRMAQERVYVNYYQTGTRYPVNSKHITLTATAHVSCYTDQQPTPAPVSAGGRTNLHPLNSCNLSGNWALWGPNPVPFILVGSSKAHGRNSDFYQVSPGNRGGVSGTAILVGRTLSLSLQRDTQVLNFQGQVDGSCARLNGRVVQSNLPRVLQARRLSGPPTDNNGARSTRKQGRVRTQTPVATPRTPVRATPNWTAHLR